MLKSILTIAGSDPCCGAGIQADIKTILLLGGYGTSVITALTAQNTCGVQEIYKVPASSVAKQIDAVVTDIDIAAVKTGMLPTSDIVKVVADKIMEHNLKNVVVDPIIFAKNGSSLLSEEAIKSITSQLLPLTYLITPNIPEAEILTGMKINNLNDIKRAAKAVKKSGTENVLIKGGHLNDCLTHKPTKRKVIDILYDGKSFEYFEYNFIPTRGVHGTGCAYSAAIATKLATGNSLVNAVQEAKKFISEAIEKAINLGKGYALIHHNPDNTNIS